MSESSSPNVAVGRLQMHPNGFGFVHIEGDAENVFIPPRRAGGALDADIVEVATRPSEKGVEGRVVRVVERRRKRIVGVLRRAGRKRLFIELEDRRILHEVVLEGGANGCVAGDVVVASITVFPESDRDPVRVEVDRSIGAPGLLQTEVAKILVEHNVDEEFPEEVEKMAEGVPTEVRPEDIENREDLRALPFMTIDPDDARDFDDAVCVELLGEDEALADMRLHVAVADVSHYVREGTVIDKEATWRCFSVYLPDRAISMLPEQLSTHMCSLVPHEDRLAMVVSMTINAGGEVSDVSPCAAVIHSHGRLSYGQVAAELSEKSGAELPAEVGDRVRRLRAASDRLRKHRMTRGAIELNLPESRVVLDEDDSERIRDVVRARSSEEMSRAYNLIEEMMVAANEAIGQLAMKAKLPLPYRVHDRPDEEKLAALCTAALSLGIKVNPESLQTSRGVQKFLGKMSGRDRADAMHSMMLRAMAQADYRTENVGHFALSAPAYVHFTSPIRRYPDLIAHRVIKAFLEGKRGPSGPPPVPTMPKEEATKGQCIRSGERERAAAQAERDTQRLFAAAHMRERVGDRFEGTVSGFSSQGMFVTLDAPFVDGMVKMQQMETEFGDQFDLDETGVRVVGSGGKLITIGDRVVIDVLEASLVRRQVDFSIVSVLTRGALTEGEAAIVQKAKDGVPKTATQGSRRRGSPKSEGGEGMSVLEAARSGRLGKERARPSGPRGKGSRSGGGGGSTGGGDKAGDKAGAGASKKRRNRRRK